MRLHDPSALSRALRGLVSERDDPYPSVDLRHARLLGAVLWLVGGSFALLLLPLAPPTHAFGWPGWIVAGAGIAGCFALARRRLDDALTPGFNEILAASFFGLGLVVALEWIAGGRGSPYHYLFILPVVHTAAVHRLGRLALFSAALVVGVCLPLVYEPYSSELAVDCVAQILLLAALGLASRLLVAAVRRQRAELRAAQGKAERFARRDPLTGLGNRLAFEEALEVEIARARRAGSSLALMIGDLDRFKAVNDLHGHLRGDDCLREVAQALLGATRTEEACYRWGGDEFAVLLPGAGHDEAAEACRRLSTAVTATACPSAGDAPVGMTCGVAEYQPGQSPAEVLARADDVLLALKGSQAPTDTERVRLERSVFTGGVDA